MSRYIRSVRNMSIAGIEAREGEFAFVADSAFDVLVGRCTICIRLEDDCGKQSVKPEKHLKPSALRRLAKRAVVRQSSRLEQWESLCVELGINANRVPTLSVGDNVAVFSCGGEQEALERLILLFPHVVSSNWAEASVPMGRGGCQDVAYAHRTGIKLAKDDSIVITASPLGDTGNGHVLSTRPKAPKHVDACVDGKEMNKLPKASKAKRRGHGETNGPYDKNPDLAGNPVAFGRVYASPLADIPQEEKQESVPCPMYVDRDGKFHPVYVIRKGTDDYAYPEYC